jgi:hypothetical protein
MEKKTKTIEERVEEFLNEDPKTRHERTQRRLAEAIVRLDMTIEAKQEARARRKGWRYLEPLTQ